MRKKILLAFKKYLWRTTASTVLHSSGDRKDGLWLGLFVATYDNLNYSDKTKLCRGGHNVRKNVILFQSPISATRCPPNSNAMGSQSEESWSKAPSALATLHSSGHRRGPPRRPGRGMAAGSVSKKEFGRWPRKSF